MKYVIAILLMATFFTCGYVAPRRQVTVIPSQMQLQRILRNSGYYHGEIDGVCGKNTQKAWDKYYSDQWGIKDYE